MLKERNFAVRDADPQDVAVLTKMFDADFTLTEPDLSCTRLILAPVNARERLLGLIKSAKTSIAVHSMQLGDRDVRDALAERKAAGVQVRAVLADPSWIDANASAAAFLASKGIESRWVEHLHVKSIVVDGTLAYVGSVNLSYNSITKNREVGLLVTEPANVQTALTTFEKDWQLGTTIGAGAPSPVGTVTP
jgi:phosphatidylserine/phosphatidylglycerophosphate/cardiolipin synthase-like enzyme